MARILVVDDDPVVLQTIRLVLKLAGHDVIGARDGVDCEDILQTAQFDMVITDLFMPRQTGPQTIRRLRARNSNIKFLLLSGGGHDVLDVQAAAHQCGADAALLKPFDPDELIEAVTALLAKSPTVVAPTGAVKAKPAV